MVVDTILKKKEPQVCFDHLDNYIEEVPIKKETLSSGYDTCYNS